MFAPVVHEAGVYRPLRLGELVEGVTLVEEIFVDFSNSGEPLQLKYLPEVGRLVIASYCGAFLVPGLNYTLSNNQFLLGEVQIPRVPSRVLYVAYYTKDLI